MMIYMYTKWDVSLSTCSPGSQQVHMLSEISLHIFLCVQHKVEDFMTTLLPPTLLTLPLTINPLALHSQLPFLSPSLPPSFPSSQFQGASSAGIL